MAIIILFAMILLFAGAAYLAYTLYGKEATLGVAGLFVITLTALFVLNGLNFGGPTSGSGEQTGSLMIR